SRISLSTSDDQISELWQEDVRDIDELVDVDETPDTDKARRNFFWLQTIAFLLGLGLLVYIINRVGVQPIFDALVRIGLLGFLVVVAISGSRHVLRTIAMAS